MDKFLRYTLLAIVAVVMVACGNTQRTVVMHDNEHNSWDDYEDFYYDNSDTLGKRDIDIVVR